MAGEKRIAFADFAATILPAVKADLSSTGCKEDYVEGLKVSSAFFSYPATSFAIRASFSVSQMLTLDRLEGYCRNETCSMHGTVVLSKL